MTKRPWWKTAVVYEIYCKSFCDSNGDGIGDLQGVISKLEMLRDLGINCIWFTPLYVSPQVDNGYDVADYRAIDPIFGTMEDFKELLDRAHSMGIRIIMDMVLNHSSDMHPWFQASRSSKDSPYRDYYIWKAPKEDGSEPNNWGNYFEEGNGSAWTFDEKTGEYYFHQYSSHMPDLNWECKALREEIYAMLNEWLDLGVDGFRLDVITRLKKMPGFPDSTLPPVPGKEPFVIDKNMCCMVDGIHDYLQELNQRVFSRPGCMTVGEGSGLRSWNVMDYVHRDRKELDMVYHFELAHLLRQEIPNALYTDVQTRWAEVVRSGGWCVQYLSNHDIGRQVSTYGEDGTFRIPSAKLLATLIHTTPGTPFIFQGEEIGMTNVHYDSIEDHNCLATLARYHKLIGQGMGPKEALLETERVSRDNARTPYQWNGGENAGFTVGKPWLKVNSRAGEINLEDDLASEDSIFRYYRKLCDLRREHPAIVEGDLRFYGSDEQVLCYTRSCKEEVLLILANKSSRPATFSFPGELNGKKGTLLLTNLSRDFSLEETMQLSPWEAAVFSVQ